MLANIPAVNDMPSGRPGPRSRNTLFPTFQGWGAPDLRNCASPCCTSWSANWHLVDGGRLGLSVRPHSELPLHWTGGRECRTLPGQTLFASSHAAEPAALPPSAPDAAGLDRACSLRRCRECALDPATPQDVCMQGTPAAWLSIQVGAALERAGSGRLSPACSGKETPTPYSQTAGKTTNRRPMSKMHAWICRPLLISQPPARRQQPHN